MNFTHKQFCINSFLQPEDSNFSQTSIQWHGLQTHTDRAEAKSATRTPTPDLLNPSPRKHARYLSPPLRCCSQTRTHRSIQLRLASHSQTVPLSLVPRKLLSPQGFSFLLPFPPIPVFFQQQPLFHSWELLPFKEKDSVRSFSVSEWESVCVFSGIWSSDHPSATTCVKLGSRVISLSAV